MGLFFDFNYSVKNEKLEKINFMSDSNFMITKLCLKYKQLRK